MTYIDFINTPDINRRFLLSCWGATTTVNKFVTDHHRIYGDQSINTIKQRQYKSNLVDLIDYEPLTEIPNVFRYNQTTGIFSINNGTIGYEFICPKGATHFAAKSFSVFTTSVDIPLMFKFIGESCFIFKVDGWDLMEPDACNAMRPRLLKLLDYQLTTNG